MRPRNPDRRNRRTPRRAVFAVPAANLRREGFSLIEILIVVALMGALTAAAIPYFEANIPAQLDATAQIIVADLDYARSLAVSNGSRYRVTFDPTLQRYVLEHSGANPTLDAMPPSPFRRPGDPVNQHVVDLTALPHIGTAAAIVGVRLVDGSTGPASDVEFGPLGALTRSQRTEIWLSAGQGAQRRYVAIDVDPVTGLASVGEIVATMPTAVAKEI